MSKPRVVIYCDKHGNWSVKADEGVDVYSVDELVPDDRLYHMDPDPIDESIMHGEVHWFQDGSPAALRISKAIKEAHGLPAFDVVKS